MTCVPQVNILPTGKIIHFLCILHDHLNDETVLSFSPHLDQVLDGVPPTFLGHVRLEVGRELLVWLGDGPLHRGGHKLKVSPTAAAKLQDAEGGAPALRRSLGGGGGGGRQGGEEGLLVRTEFPTKYYGGFCNSWGHSWAPLF